MLQKASVRGIPPGATFYDELVEAGLGQSNIGPPCFLVQVTDFFHVAQQVSPFGLRHAVFDRSGAVVTQHRKHLRHVHDQPFVLEGAHHGDKHVYFFIYLRVSGCWCGGSLFRFGRGICRGGLAVGRGFPLGRGRSGGLFLLLASGISGLFCLGRCCFGILLAFFVFFIFAFGGGVLLWPGGGCFNTGLAGHQQGHLRLRRWRKKKKGQNSPTRGGNCTFMFK